MYSCSRMCAWKQAADKRHGVEVEEGIELGRVEREEEAPRRAKIAGAKGAEE